MKCTNKLIIACLSGCLHIVQVRSMAEINATGYDYCDVGGKCGTRR